MIQVTPGMRVLVATEPADFRKGIDGLAAICRRELRQDPMSGCVFVFRNRRATAVKVLVYDGQGFWLAQKRMSQGRFPHWPRDAAAVLRELQPQQFQVLVTGGNPERAEAAPAWRPIGLD